MMAARQNVTDRAKRYRAQNNVRGEKRCVICGSTSDLGVMHLDGNESHGEQANLAYGCRSCNQKLAAAFKRIGAGVKTKQYNPSQGVPSFQQYSWAVSNHARGSHDEAGAIIHATPKHKRIAYAKQIAGLKRERGTDSSLPEWARNPGTVVVRPSDRWKGRWEVAAPGRVVETRKSKRGAISWAKSMVESKNFDSYEVQENPAAASAKAFEDFHGYEPTERVVVKQEVHHHKHLAAAGELVGLQVKTLKGDTRKIEGLGKALLCFNEQMNQLFVRGGDQYMSESELQKFGADGGHELETLGQIVGVGYFTNKTHLGDEGGEAIYSHKFRTTNEAGRHVTVSIARNPYLMYRVLDQQFEISGGSYTIRAEGIDK